MKKTISLVLAAMMMFFVVAEASAATRVRGYYRKNGTYVAPYYRSNTDSNFYNNYSTYGNTNPYTGKKGYKRHK